MNIQRLLLPSIALGAAAALLLPTISEGFALLPGGQSLSTSQRDVRVFNNFLEASANNNTATDANFPGYLGAPMAAWKAVVEWGSNLHGNGNGDPHQPGGLGSGAANFDATWAGLATSAGTTNDNVISEIPGCSGGVLAFTETPITDGWRMLFYQCNWFWDDGPGTSIGSNTDIQGVVCHEYGHALGLDHSAIAGATMFPSISGSGVAQRSIATDDTQGVQAIYLVASASKPRITGVTAAFGQVQITGQNFGLTGNQVWFTPSAATAPDPGGTHNPIVIASNISSSGGTSISLSLPAAAGSGDVFVKLSSSGNATLSNGWPLDTANASCPAPSYFCTVTGNSYDPGGSIIGSSGTTSIAANNFVLVTFSVPPGVSCLYFYGTGQSEFAPLGNGFRCINAPLFRLPVTTANIFGDVQFNVDLNSMPPGGSISSGQSWGFQLWYRDPAAPGASYNVSNGLSTTWCP